MMSKSIIYSLLALTLFTPQNSSAEDDLSSLQDQFKLQNQFKLREEEKFRELRNKHENVAQQDYIRDICKEYFPELLHGLLVDYIDKICGFAFEKRYLPFISIGVVDNIDGQAFQSFLGRQINIFEINNMGQYVFQNCKLENFFAHFINNCDENGFFKSHISDIYIKHLKKIGHRAFQESVANNVCIDELREIPLAMFLKSDVGCLTIKRLSNPNCNGSEGFKELKNTTHLGLPANMNLSGSECFRDFNKYPSKKLKTMALYCHGDPKLNITSVPNFIASYNDDVFSELDLLRINVNRDALSGLTNDAIKDRLNGLFDNIFNGLPDSALANVEYVDLYLGEILRDHQINIIDLNFKLVGDKPRNFELFVFDCTEPVFGCTRAPIFSWTKILPLEHTSFRKSFGKFFAFR